LTIKVLKAFIDLPQKINSIIKLIEQNRINPVPLLKGLSSSGKDWKYLEKLISHLLMSAELNQDDLTQILLNTSSPIFFQVFLKQSDRTDLVLDGYLKAVG